MYNSFNQFILALSINNIFFLSKQLLSYSFIVCQFFNYILTLFPYLSFFDMSMFQIFFKSSLLNALVGCLPLLFTGFFIEQSDLIDSFIVCLKFSASFLFVFTYNSTVGDRLKNLIHSKTVFANSYTHVMQCSAKLLS